MTIIPIGQQQHRLPQAGRIRIGAKDERARGGRRAINTFRFTSHDADLLAPIASQYGGNVVPWNEPKSGDRFEVVTRADKVNVILPPNALSEYYELWKGDKGLLRRCTGEVCDLAATGPDGPEIRPVPCICDAKGKRECDYKLRLSVMLPDVASVGSWRLDTSSEYARAEIPSVVKIIEMVDQGRGLFRAVLRLEQRTLPGKRFNVPVLDTGVGVEALLAGETRLNVLPVTAIRPAELGAGDAVGGVADPHVPPAASPSTDDDIIDAVVYDEATGVQPVNPAIGRAYLKSLSTHQQNKALLRARDLALELGEEIPTSVDTISPLIADRLVAEYEKGT